MTALCAVLFSACKFENFSFNGPNLIQPSEQIVKNEYRQSAFDRLDVDIVANVKFIQSHGDDYRIVLSCPDNYVDLFRFTVSHGKLEVKFSRDNVNIEPKNVDVTIYAPTLKALDNSGVASVEIDRLETGKLEIDNSGVGTLYLSGLKVDVLEADCSGVGSVQLKGTAGTVDLDCSGVGSITAYDLKARSVKAEVSGVGSVSCYASESIEGEVSGVGSLKYGGAPSQKNLKREGVGGIVEI